MKKVLLLCFIALGICFSSCQKEKAIDRVYDFSGVYTVMVDSGYVYPGRIINPDTVLVIEYTNENEVKTKGYFNTTGIVRDSLLYFESIEITTDTWYGNNLPEDKIDFVPATKEGNLLYLSFTQESWIWGSSGSGSSAGAHSAKLIAFKH